MKQKILKKSFLIISLFVFILVLFLSTPTVSAFDNSDERDGYTISDIKELISNENQIEVYSEDGTMEIMDEPLSIYNEDSTVDLTNLRASTSFEEVKIVDSGKPDSESIVVTLMGDGFTATEQNNFINAANNAANYLIGNDSTGDQGFYPYNLFRDYFTIYAIKVISEESGVSRDANTNNGHIVNNYFGSSFYYGNNSSTTQRALVITKDDKARALEKTGSSMTAIICNSSRWGGTGGEFAVLSMHTNFGQILTHEFGHSFGGLADEYWYEGEPFRATEAVNKTQNGNLNTIKWKHWIGKSGIYSGIGAYRFSSNSSNTAYNWYKPHQNCQMQYSDEPFCAVCAEELIKRMEAKTGSFFETTSISDTQIKIDNVNYTLYNAFEIPPVLNGKEVVFIGSNAFKNQLNLTNIVIPSSVTNIDSSAFENCSYLQSVTLPTNLVSIGTSAFKGCGSLGSITIPSNVQYIDDSAFENCVSLVSVVVERGISNITNLGNSAFAGCSSTLQIIVPQNRVAEYKNKVYWSSYKNKIIPDSTDFDELNLHCLVDDSSDVTLSAGYNELYKLNVECNKSYKFMTSSGIELKVYDEYFDELYTGENTLYAYLSPGTYYLDVRYNSSTASGTITIDYELRWTHDGERVYYNDEHNLLTHLHETSDGTYFNKLYYINNNGAGFYKFQLNGTYSNNLPIVYDSGTLTIYNDSGRLETQVLNRYPNSSIMASSDYNQDTMYVYLPRNGYFYINVVMPSDSYESLSLIVSPISSQNINLFNLNENANHLISVINNTDKGDYVETLNVEQTGKFTISYNYNGSSTDNFVFLLVKQNYNSTTNQYSFSTIINKTMNATNNSFTYTGNLEAGKYYIGYLNKNDNSSVVANFVRLVTDSNNQKLLPDPDMFTVYGSEVRFNNGVCRGTNLTVGFTRFIYLDNTLDIRSQSRLDYYWYSSDENVASISDYGTLLGLSPGIVKIMAVYKNDPSVVYVKQFTVLPDTRTEDLVVEISESITYAESGQIYEISLTDTNSPYPLNSLYEWSVVLDESSYSVTVTEWGTFSMSGTGTIVLEGRSKLNPHLVVRFTLIVT